MKTLLQSTLLLASLSLLTGCNAGALAVATIVTPDLGPTTVGGTLTAAPTAAKVGYIAWVEQLEDGNVKGLLNFDLVKEKNVTFDHATVPTGDRFSLDLQPHELVVEGTYVVFAWDDVNNDNIYQGEQGEVRAPEVYRIRGQGGLRNIWTTEKFVFTDKKLAIEYAEQNGLAFSFQPSSASGDANTTTPTAESSTTPAAP